MKLPWISKVESKIDGGSLEKKGRLGPNTGVFVCCFYDSYGMPSLPSTIHRWTRPWMVKQLGQFW